MECVLICFLRVCVCVWWSHGDTRLLQEIYCQKEQGQGVWPEHRHNFFIFNGNVKIFKLLFVKYKCEWRHVSQVMTHLIIEMPHWIKCKVSLKCCNVVNFVVLRMHLNKMHDVKAFVWFFFYEKKSIRSTLLVRLVESSHGLLFSWFFYGFFDRFLFQK